MNFKPCKLRYQDQDYRIASDGIVTWLCNTGPQLVCDELSVLVRSEATRIRRNRAQRIARNSMNSAMDSIGMVKVRGALAVLAKCKA